MTWRPPDLASLNARLDSQNRRVQGYLEDVTGRLDVLIDAALAGDWDSVRRWSEETAQVCTLHGEVEILQSAHGLLEAASRADSPAEVKSRVMQLIAACGKVQRRAKMQAGKTDGSRE